MDNQAVSDAFTSIKARIEKLIEEGHLAESKELLDQIRANMPWDADVFSMLSVIALMEGSLDEAQKLLQEGLLFNKCNFDLLFNMAYVNEQRGNYDNAAEFYLKAKKVSNEAQSEIIENAVNHLNHISSKTYNLIVDQTESEKVIKVLHGTMEIANQMHMITKGLKNQGIQADTLNYYPNYLGFKSDYVYDINANKDKERVQADLRRIVDNAIRNYDLFHFHFGTTLTQNYVDLPMLISAGKKIFMHYWGSDVRLHSQAVKLNRYAVAKDMNEEMIKRRMHFLSGYIEDCIVGDYELYEYVKDYYKRVHVVPVAIDLSEFIYDRESENMKPVVVHAPTSKSIKGTEFILSAVEDLKKKYDFEFILISSMTNEAAKKIYCRADIIIDQLLLGSHGVFAVESMALGKPVISWISDFMRDKYPKDLPIVSANPDTIKQQLEILLKDKQLREDLGMRGRQYTVRHHDMNAVSKKILDLYKS